MVSPADYIRWFDAIRLEDIQAVGGKNATMAELYRALGDGDVRVSNGFALIAGAYEDSLTEADAWPILHRLLDGLDVTDLATLADRAASARSLVYDATDNAWMRLAIDAAYRQLESQYGANVAVAVRNSATAEDVPTARFAGQHESYLDVSGTDDVFDACRQCFASLFTDRGIVYRVNHGFDHFKAKLSVGVMRMVHADTVCSGVLYTCDTASGAGDVMCIALGHGPREASVRGQIERDRFYLDKPAFKQGHHDVLRCSLARKAPRVTGAADGAGSMVRDGPTSDAASIHVCLEDAEVLALAAAAIRIEDHYTQCVGRAEPLELTWAKDADDGRLYILQARPQTARTSHRASLGFTQRPSASPWPPPPR